VLYTLNYGESLLEKTAKVVTQLPSGETENYFLKVSCTTTYPNPKIDLML
jgi:hypothetical protein